MTKGADFDVVWTGDKAHVRLSPEAAKAYSELKADPNRVRALTQLERYFGRFCDAGERTLPREHFRFEESKSVNGKKVPIFTFKPWQWRLYGSIYEVAGKRAFVGTKVDPGKKKDRADQALLKAAAEEISALTDYKGDDDDQKAKRKSEKRRDGGGRAR